MAAPVPHLCPAADAICHPHAGASIADEIGILPASICFGWVWDHARPRLQQILRHKGFSPAQAAETGDASVHVALYSALATKQPMSKREKA
jgi:hypothetical protein